MTHEERSAIVNGIWLCQTCGKLVDNDVRRFTVDVLYGWKREHEARVLEEIGYEPGERERRQRISAVYANESPAAKQIALDQPLHWEYLLLAELLRSKLGRIQGECHRLERGLIYQRVHEIRTPLDLLRWSQCRMRELRAILEMIDIVINKDIKGLLGESGKPGDVDAILQAANDVNSACVALFEWKCDFRFSFWPHGYEDAFKVVSDLTKEVVSKLRSIPEFFQPSTYATRS